MKNSRPASVVVHSPRPAGFTYPCNSSIAGPNSHARADTTGALNDIHRRVATAILFESSGGQTDKSAHLPELRFALGEPGVETTSIDFAASQMEARGFFIRKKGTDGFQFGFKPTLNKVVNDRRACLDEEEILAETNRIVEKKSDADETARPVN